MGSSGVRHARDVATSRSDAHRLSALSQLQRDLLSRWLPGVSVVRDHSWGLVGTVVLELSLDGHRYVVKAGDDADTHIARELQAHRAWLGPWTSRGRAPQLVHGDADAKLLVTRYLPGRLVLGADEQWEADTHRQAGELLAQLHGQQSVEDRDYEARARYKALAWLDAAHRIPPDVVRQLRTELGTWPTPTAMVVPTHGDWQPRNWLTHRGTLRVIDFGRVELRPAYTDFARLEVQQFAADPALEAACLAGYGDDPRDPVTSWRNRVRDAIGTAVWAHQVGDEGFENQGLRVLSEALSHRE